MSSLGTAEPDDRQAFVLAGLRYPVAIAGQASQGMNVRDRMSYYAVPAVSIAVVRDNRIAWSAAIGVRRAGTSDTMTSATLMQAASISKPIVAVAVMRLAEQGRLAIGDSANAYLRSWRIAANSLTVRAPVTIARLLSHTAGATNGAVGIYAPGTPTPTLLQALDGAPPSNRPPVTIDLEPGTTYRYAGGGYSILQQMLIDVAGTPFPDLMRSQVLDPVGMRASCFCQPLPASMAGVAAAGHDNTGKPIPGGWWTLPEMAAGGLWTTAGDLARFVIAMNRSWRGEPNALLTRADAQRMLTPGLGGWGLGFAVDSARGELRYSHTGSNNGYRSVMVGYPTRGDGIVVLTNGDGGAALRDEIVRAAAETYDWPGDRVVTRTVNATANATLADFAGRYQYGPRFSSTFMVTGDSLSAQLNTGAASRVYSEGPDVFFSVANTTYRFVRDARGAVVAVVAGFADGSQLRGERVQPLDPGAPAPARPLAIALVDTASASARAISIPLDVDGARVYVPVRIAGDSVRWFILDTGASPTIVDADVARRLHLAVTDAGTTTGAGANTLRQSRARAVTLDVGGVSLGPMDVVVGKLDSLLAPSQGRPAPGLIGSRFFLEHVVDLDFSRLTMQVHDPRTFRYDGNGVVLPLHLNNGVPLVDGSMTTPDGAVIPMRLLVDLGAKSGLLVSEPFIRAHGVAARFPHRVVMPLGAGVGGETRYAFVRVPRLTIGSGPTIVTDSLLTGLSVAGTLRSDWYDGLLGAEFLQRYRVIFDYSRERVILERREPAVPPTEFDMSGMYLLALGDDHRRITVREILAGGPAAVAGIRAGDVIVSLDGSTAGSLTLGDVRRALHAREGRAVRLEIERGGARIVKIVTLRRLL